MSEKILDQIQILCPDRCIRRKYDSNLPKMMMYYQVVHYLSVNQQNLNTGDDQGPDHHVHHIQCDLVVILDRIIADPFIQDHHDHTVNQDRAVNLGHIQPIAQFAQYPNRDLDRVHIHHRDQDLDRLLDQDPTHIHDPDHILDQDRDHLHHARDPVHNQWRSKIEKIPKKILR